MTALYGPHHGGGGLKYGYSLHAYRRRNDNAIVVATSGNCGDRRIYTGTAHSVLKQLETLVENGWTVS